MNLKDEYKKETGNYVHFRETESGKKLYYEDYVEWIEDRLIKLLSIQNVSDNCNWCETLSSDYEQNIRGDEKVILTIEERNILIKKSEK
jgi:hypothetical protein